MTESDSAPPSYPSGESYPPAGLGYPPPYPPANPPSTPPAANHPPPPVKAPPSGWPAVAAGLLGVLGLFLPWFHPRLSKPFNGITDLGHSYHAYSGFRVLAIAPILLIVWAVFWLQALRGRDQRRPGSARDPIRALSVQSMVAGVVALVAALLSFALMKYHYKDWDTVAKLVRTQGASLQKNPGIGLYLVLLGAVLLITAGALTFANTRPATDTAEPSDTVAALN